MAQKIKYSDYNVNRDDLPDGAFIFGDGQVGGKAKGILYSMEALQKGLIKGKYLDLVSFPRSYIVTSEFYDRFIEENYLKDVVSDKCREILSVKEMNHKFLEGKIPDELSEVLFKVLEKEDGPLIVRSSSILEDSMEYSFAGIYESYFIPNTGTLEHRVKNLEQTVKMVYASTFNNNAKGYRKIHRISWQREKMSLVIENVIGRKHRREYYYPFMAGVAFSRNYYPWNDRIKMEDGVGRLVLGLGTRAVGRNYARVFSLSNPHLRPEGSVLNEIIRYSQKYIDVLNLSTGEFVSEPLNDMKDTSNTMYIACSTLKDNQYLTPTPKSIGKDENIFPTFDRLLKSDKYFPFVPLMKELLTNIEEHFGVPIDIEFAVDIDEEMKGYLYLLQARPIVSRPEHKKVAIPDVKEEDVIIRSDSVLGNGVIQGIKNIVYVPPDKFNASNSFAISREIGKVNEILDNDHYILIGPGRWGTSTPELGIPVNYSEISNSSVIVEVSACGTSPELSYGTHFFGDITATNTLYFPVFLDKGGRVNFDFLDSQPNKFNSELIKLVTYEKGFSVYASAEGHIGLVVKDGKMEKGQ
ncbi:MAG: phosphoenolpyruvate synthase [Candidatus Methanofastidiosa archaeon]|nr:phosphoenolpyruvate synthase [Candidatus Methanofastidiosa archaeon]